MMETFTCSRCGAEHPITDRIVFGGQELCPACLEANTCVCSRCGDRIWLDRNCGTGSMPLCESCEERYYDHCADCGCLVERGNLLYLVDPDEDCDDGEDEDGYCPQCYARHTYIKHDGSLDAGLELVTHPMTLDYHRNDMPWEAVLQKALRLGYTSHQTDTCGLHVHVNRSSLGDFWDEQEDVIARILFLVETFWHELLRFSRRTQSQMDKWASRYGRRDDPKDVLHNAKNRCDRYTCVNLTPRRTIEFRMFRGTLKYNTLIATLQLVERLCDVAISLSDNKIKAVTWSGFVAEIDPEAMPELIQYLKERRLYVNEPVFTEEEL